MGGSLKKRHERRSQVTGKRMEAAQPANPHPIEKIRHKSHEQMNIHLDRINIQRHPMNAKDPPLLTFAKKENEVFAMCLQYS